MGSLTSIFTLSIELRIQEAQSPREFQSANWPCEYQRKQNRAHAFW